MADLARIKRNVAKMAEQGAPEADIDGYIASEGVTVEDVRNFKPQQQGQMPPGVMPFATPVSFSQGAVNSVPIVGPAINEGISNVRGQLGALIGNSPLGGLLPGLQGKTAEQIKAEADQFVSGAVAQEPGAYVAGQVFGTVAPLAAAGTTAAGAKLLGMSGNLASRIGMGVLSSFGIGGGDTLARGGTPQDALKAGIIGGAIGGGLPVVGAAVGKAVGSLLGKGVPKPVANVAQAMKEDQIDPAQLQTQLQGMGEGAMVMDAGPNLQTLAGGIASVRGPGQKVIRDAVTSRAKQAGARVATDLAQTFGTGPEIGALTEQIVSAQSAAAKPLYDAVRPLAVQPTPNLRFVFQTPMGKQALKKAVALAQNDGFDLSGGLNVGIVDYMKRALDDIVSTAKRTGENNTVRQASEMAALLKKEVDAQVPEYAQARAAFAGPAQVLDAIEAGKTVFAKDVTPRQLEQQIADMTDGEKDAFLQAARSSVEGLVGNATNDALAVRNLFKKGFNEQKLRILLGSDIADDLMRRINREAAFGVTTNVVTQNSETARRAAAQGMVDPTMAPTERPQGTIGLLFSAIDLARSRLRGVTQPKVNQGMAKLLTSGAGGLDPALLSQLERAFAPAKNAALAPASGALLGNQGGPNEPLRIVVQGANPLQ